MFGLSEKEIAVLLKVGQGKNNEEISRALHISKSALRSRLKNIYIKLDDSELEPKIGHSRIKLALFGSFILDEMAKKKNKHLDKWREGI